MGMKRPRTKSDNLQHPNKQQPSCSVVVLASLGAGRTPLSSAPHTSTTAASSSLMSSLLIGAARELAKSRLYKYLNMKHQPKNFNQATQTRTYNGVYLSDEKVLFVA